MAGIRLVRMGNVERYSKDRSVDSLVDSSVDSSVESLAHS